MQSITILHLRAGAHYVYCISPDQKIVVMDPQSRRVMLVMRRSLQAVSPARTPDLHPWA